ncbi:holo-ACP synthase [Thalassotalea fusca]
MSVIGVGTDIVEIARLEGMPDKSLDKLAKRVLTPRELEHFEQLNFPIPYLAKRWAAKEAASKALGTGIAKGVSFQHFDIISDINGKPELKMSGEALARAEQLCANQFHLSISDERHYALAFVILSKN